MIKKNKTKIVEYGKKSTVVKNTTSEINKVIRFVFKAIHESRNEFFRTCLIVRFVEEINILKTALADYAGRGSIYFEYNIPRMGRRADVIVLIDGIVFVMEFKTSEQKFTRASEVQVWDYALDLKNFQQGSRDRLLIPILVAPREKSKKCIFTLSPFEDNVYSPLMSNESRLKECIEHVISNLRTTAPSSPEADESWAKSGYDPTPTIIEAAVALYEEHNVADITKHDGDVEQTAICINRIIEHCRANKRKAICFVTGVPGAGKTEIYIKLAIEALEQNRNVVYLVPEIALSRQLEDLFPGVPGDNLLCPKAAKNRTEFQDYLPAAHCSQTAMRQLPESPPQPLPQTAFSGLFINQSGNFSVHRNLSALQGKGLQLQFLPMYRQPHTSPRAPAHSEAYRSRRKPPRSQARAPTPHPLHQDTSS